MLYLVSGHGGQLPDESGDVADGIDESVPSFTKAIGGSDSIRSSVIWTKDLQKITDEELHEVFVRKLRRGCQLTVSFEIGIFAP